ncbi:unnamed protein product [Brachionus calyciflorus]|uniref:Uncharacterized protein n=1 Tax=Brachionus calyciflorus TaxID=104777 RepID=A0A814CQK4_9BILA|nr:unnamed protein product [Brachionus calyciflorus]
MALSKYKIILADNRQNMSDETIKMNNFLYFNTGKDQILQFQSSDDDICNDDYSDDDFVQIDDDSGKEN